MLQKAGNRWKSCDSVSKNHWPSSATAVTNQQSALDWLHSQFMETPQHYPSFTNNFKNDGVNL